MSAASMRINAGIYAVVPAIDTGINAVATVHTI